MKKSPDSQLKPRRGPKRPERREGPSTPLALGNRKSRVLGLMIALLGARIINSIAPDEKTQSADIKETPTIISAESPIENISDISTTTEAEIEAALAKKEAKPVDKQ